MTATRRYSWAAYKEAAGLLRASANETCLLSVLTEVCEPLSATAHTQTWRDTEGGGKTEKKKKKKRFQASLAQANLFYKLFSDQALWFWTTSSDTTKLTCYNGSQH